MQPTGASCSCCCFGEQAKGPGPPLELLLLGPPAAEAAEAAEAAAAAATAADGNGEVRLALVASFCAATIRLRVPPPTKAWTM